jgi:hypothetical protein
MKSVIILLCLLSTIYGEYFQIQINGETFFEDLYQIEFPTVNNEIINHTLYNPVLRNITFDIIANSSIFIFRFDDFDYAKICYSWKHNCSGIVNDINLSLDPYEFPLNPMLIYSMGETYVSYNITLHMEYVANDGWAGMKIILIAFAVLMGMYLLLIIVGCIGYCLNNRHDNVSFLFQ